MNRRSLQQSRPAGTLRWEGFCVRVKAYPSGEAYHILDPFQRLALNWFPAGLALSLLITEKGFLVCGHGAWENRLPR
jgi:hypothetical protein